MIATAPTLAPKLAGVLARACSCLGAINKSQASKIPYLVDVAGVALLGRRITEGTHQAWKMGVVTREAFSAVAHDHLPPGFSRKRNGAMAGGMIVSLDPAKPYSDGSLVPEERAIVDSICSRFGGLRVEMLGELTKRMNPEIPPEAWGKNGRVAVDADAYARLGGDYQHYAGVLARDDVGDRSRWGAEIVGDPREYLRRTLGR